MQHILVIDDDPAVTSLLKRGLSYEGFAVDTATSGAEGLAMARERPSDLVILDVMMPGLGGFEVLQRLRAADEQLPVLMLTARDAPTDQVQGLESGADDYVVKPFTFDVLLARIHALLRRRQADHPAILRFADLTWIRAALPSFEASVKYRSLTLSSECSRNFCSIRSRCFRKMYCLSGSGGTILMPMWWRCM